MIQDQQSQPFMLNTLLYKSNPPSTAGKPETNSDQVCDAQPHQLYQAYSVENFANTFEQLGLFHQEQLYILCTGTVFPSELAIAAMCYGLQVVLIDEQHIKHWLNTQSHTDRYVIASADYLYQDQELSTRLLQHDSLRLVVWDYGQSMKWESSERLNQLLKASSSNYKFASFASGSAALKVYDCADSGVLELNQEQLCALLINQNYEHKRKNTYVGEYLDIIFDGLKERLNQQN
ncbi:hypothetical protein DBZ36_11260 [Alginatibacterium sediminis]|uniref:Uncharacterized protein n=1 Tax=Alginatibacterium sediminis TaxID=2164068 RepID=A0A420EAW2_9ALTE|nr:hypothetical protein [Alginatibacterium sediminis]RKF17829.1 hypothetical protein DBZ36_11260 [Alginatibacterium sediminis]